MTRKVMKLINPSSGLMECKICGERHVASLQSGHNRKDGVTRYYRGSWQCVNKCKLLSHKIIPRGTDLKKAKILRSIRKKMKEMEKDVPFKDGILD